MSTEENAWVCEPAAEARSALCKPGGYNSVIKTMNLCVMYVWRKYVNTSSFACARKSSNKMYRGLGHIVEES